MNNYYKILGITPDANFEDIRKAHRKLALKYHPDINDGDPFFENLFKDAQEAYECLSNSISKREYDNQYKNFFSSIQRPIDEAPIDNDPLNEKLVDEKGPPSILVFIIILIIIFIGFIVAQKQQHEPRNSTDEIVVIDTMSVITDSVVVDSTTLDSNVIDSQNIVVTNEPESTQIVDNLSTEDKAVISFLQEYYDFYDRDNVFRNPLVKKVDDYNYDVSVEECSRHNEGNDFFYRAKIIDISIDESGNLKMGRTYRNIGN